MSKTLEEQHTILVLDYILEHEEEDFLENPSDTHVFYDAMVATDGFRHANGVLEQAKKAVQDG